MADNLSSNVDLVKEPTTKDDILDILNEETPVRDKDKGEGVAKPRKGVSEDGKEEEDSEGDEDIESEESGDAESEGESEKEDDEDELDEEVLRLKPEEIQFPKKKEILKEFPNLFKKFPSIEHAIYRDRQFSDVFATPDDAREANAKAQQLDNVSEDIGRGDLAPLLKTVKDNDPNLFYGIVDGLMDTLGSIDQRAYHHVIGNVIKYTIMAMADDAKANRDQELMDQAVALNRWVFRNDKFEPPQRLSSRPENLDKTEAQLERQAYVREKFESAQDSLQSRVDNQIKASIDTYIDPDGNMTKFVKKHATQEAFTKLEDLLGNDRVLKSTLNRLWRAAHGENYSSSSLDKIRAAYLSKAKTYLRDVIRGARNEAMKESRKSNSSTSSDRERLRGHIAVGRSAGNSSSRRGEIPKGMSSKDFIMSD